MERECEACGRPFEAKNKLARFCTEVDCRRRRARARKQKQLSGRVVDLRPPDDPPAGQSGVSTYSTTLDRLTSAGRVETPLGQAALRLAARIDGSHSDTGSSLAAMVRELAKTLVGALEGAATPDDPVDELRAARERRQRGA